MRSRSRASGDAWDAESDGDSRDGPTKGHPNETNSDVGSVTAEFAALVPAVLLVLAFCLGGVQVVGLQLRLTDAAADAARSLARGDGQAQAAARVRISVGRVSMSTETRGGFVCVRLASEAAFAPAATMGMTVQARGCALGEGRGDTIDGGEGEAEGEGGEGE